MRRYGCSLITFFFLHFFTLSLLLYFDYYVAEVGIQAYSWSINSWSRIKYSSSSNLFNLPQEYRRSNSNTTVVLLWKPAFENVQLNEQLDADCVLTLDQSAADVADAILFHFRETPDSPAFLPSQNRNPNQIWIWYSQEPPSHTLHQFKKTLTPLNGIFNWTMTYRFDSDILSSYRIPYSTYYMKEEELKILMKQKTADALGVAMVSNCASKFRQNMISKLSKYIDIDVFGKCSGRILCRGECQEKTLLKYKFILSFENSLCRHYISEKFWVNGLGSSAVPIVMGASKEAYRLVAPNHSFIHVDDFSSVEELSKHLLKLHHNDDLYLEYFKWKLHPKRQDDLLIEKVKSHDPKEIKGLQESILYGGNSNEILCRKLKNRDGNTRKVIEHLDTWWHGDTYTRKNQNINVCREQDNNSTNVRYFIIVFYFLLFIISLLLFLYRIFCK